MVDKMFGIFDLKMKLFLTPFCARNVDAGIRSFADACANANAPFAKHPEDYVLYEIGAFDMESGELVRLNPIHVVSKALDFVDNSVKNGVDK